MTTADFIAAFPDLQDEPATTITAVISSCAGEFDTAMWGSRLSYGLGLLVAHRLQMAKDERTGSGTRDVVSKSVGGVSVSRSAALIEKQWANPLLLTRYGREYYSLASRVGMGGLSV